MSEPSLDDLRREARRLTAALTLEEKASQMLFLSPAIPRLGIPAYCWWNECLHGVARAGRATVFPQAIGLAATFDPRLVQRVFSAVADEARAKHAAAAAQGYRGIYAGLTFWTPTINIFRDPRWGRGQETYGEDPFLTATMGAAVVRGLQGEHPVWLKTAACAKHFAVHSGPEGERHGFDARVSARDLHETYLPAFRALVGAGVEAVMGAYNRVNGEPACASPTLMRILREQWGFAGHFVSDCGALDDLHRHHRVTADALESTVLAVRAGCDLNCGETYRHLVAAVRGGRLAEAELDRAVERLLLCRLRLGLLGRPALPWPALPEREIAGPRHRRLARLAAQRSIVLLKNDGILPLPRDAGAYFVTGPYADDPAVLLGNYHGHSGCATTILQGIVAAVSAGTVIHAGGGAAPSGTPGFGGQWVIPYGRPHAIIAVVGLSPREEGEEGDAVASPAQGDRLDIALPPAQEEALRQLAAHGIPLVVILTGGSPISSPWLAEHANAVLQVFYPGGEGGHAVADVLFGAVSPSGRLPFTVPRATADLPPFADYNMRGRTYRFAERPPLWPFGYGLSYSEVIYEHAGWRADADGGGLLTVQLCNRGARATETVVQAYLRHLAPPVPAPRLQLAAFQRLRLAAGQRRRIELPLAAERFWLYRDDGSPFRAPGPWACFVGDGQPPFDLSAYPPGRGCCLMLS
ncbi:MAG: glycoside hydrolase family 3 N-terminal domain-containing protein [Planctomycetota bacterium]|nr:glycoside hydrolase family 3 C-terminal domain-containing protein [Planctomycetota bacterium]MCX8039776.1 glycoside hydrolase family 3 C-terminal domain-containing protein [Planctomycetota bacterium]MDW8373156.1 glycoside hydrolase family 3 N-terminal domain-containing protein [Planctomycetota bacterium]